MIPQSTTITAEGRRLRRGLWMLAAGLVALNVVVWVASGFTTGGAVTGPDGSSFVTTPRGSAAVAGMLERLGVDVGRSRVPLDEAELAPGATLVVVDVAGAEYSSQELRAIESFLEGGGRLVVAGPTSMVGRLLTDTSTWQSEGGSSARPVGGNDSFTTARLGNEGSFELSDRDKALWETDGGRVVAVGRAVGRGYFVWLADATPFRNEAIGTEDSAVAVFGLVDPTGPVVFDELRHGFNVGAGLWNVLPASWRTVMILGALATLVALVSYARRFGPPHDLSRPLPPGREPFLAALAGMLGRAGAAGDAADAIATEARRRLAERAAGDADLETAAVGAGLTAEQTEAVLEPTPDHLLDADRALAILNQERP